MRVYREAASAAGRERGCVVAAGTFDGVHLGHQALFRQAVAASLAGGVPSLVLTFSPLPARKLAPGQAPPPLMTTDDRLRIAASLGVEAALVLPFTRRLASWPAARFARSILAESLEAGRVVVGEGWRFGKGREGGVSLLRSLSEELGFAVTEVPFVREGGEVVSSTRVREAVSRGEVEEARHLLGRPHFVRGRVEAGRGRGRQLGFPTVNLAGMVLLPPEGVYAGVCALSGEEGVLPAAVNIGRRPTFGGGLVTVEAHLPGLSRELYGLEVTLGFLARLREERIFPDADSLRRQIGEDVSRTVAVFAESGVEGLP